MFANIHVVFLKYKNIFNDNVVITIKKYVLVLAKTYNFNPSIVYHKAFCSHIATSTAVNLDTLFNFYL